MNKIFALQIMQISQNMLSFKNYWWKPTYLVENGLFDFDIEHFA